MSEEEEEATEEVVGAENDPKITDGSGEYQAPDAEMSDDESSEAEEQVEESTEEPGRVRRIPQRAQQNAPAATSTEPLGYNAKVERLEAIIRRLESGGLDLTETVELFEEGLRLQTACEEELTAAEGRLRELAEQSGGVEAQAPEAGE